MNDVGRTYFLMKGAQLSDRQAFDLRVRVDGNMSRYDDIRRLMARMFADQSASKYSTLGSMSQQYHFDNGSLDL